MGTTASVMAFEEAAALNFWLNVSINFGSRSGDIAWLITVWTCSVIPLDTVSVILVASVTSNRWRIAASFAGSTFSPGAAAESVFAGAGCAGVAGVPGSCWADG